SAELEAADELRAEVYDVSATLDADERRRWWAALAEAAQSEVTADEITLLDAWWSNARQAPETVPAHDEALSPGAERLLAALALAARAWPAGDTQVLGSDEASWNALCRLGALDVSSGWVVIQPAWEARAEQLVSASAAGTIGAVARALAERFPADGWA